MRDKLIVTLAVVFVAFGTTFLVLNELEKTGINDRDGIQSFESEEDMMEFLSHEQEDSIRTEAYSGGTGEAMEREAIDADSGTQDLQADKTVVQVGGIDEPDSVKTDGENLYYQGGFRDKINTSVINIDDLSIEENFTESGDLLLHENTLLVFGDEKVTGYDVEEKEEIWSEEFDHRYETARLREDEIVLVLSDSINYHSPCPINPYGGTSIPCTGIYRPGFSYDSDTTYSFLSIDPEDGSVNDESSFVGDRSSEFYITDENIYFTYTGQEPRSDVFFEFLIDHSNTLDQETKNRLAEVQTYDLSEDAYNAEIDHQMEMWAEENEEDAEELEEELEHFLVDRKREHHWTTVAKLDSDLDMHGEAEIPGNLQDRMHMHEENNELHLISSVEPGYSMWSNRTNDLVTLNERMELQDSLEDISSDSRPEARFSGENLFLTEEEETVEQYSLEELSKENEFEASARFLHPVDDRLISVGRDPEDWNLTVSIHSLEDGSEIESRVFDVSSSRVNFDMHAFQIDTESEVFFLPTNEEAKLVDYSDGIGIEELNITSARRSFFLDDIVVVGRNEIKTFDQESLSEIGQLEIPRDEYMRPVIEERVAEGDVATETIEETPSPD